MASLTFYLPTVIFISLVGGFLPLLRELSQKALALLLSFSAGVLLGAVFFHMVGYVPASYAGVWGVTLLYRIAKDSALWSPTHLTWLILALVIIPLHVQSVVLFLPAIIALLIVPGNIFRRNLVIWTAAAAALSLLANSPWLVTAFNHRSDDVAATIVDQLALFTSIDPLVFLKDYIGPNGYWTFRPPLWEKGFRLMLLSLGSWGTCCSMWPDRPD